MSGTFGVESSGFAISAVSSTLDVRLELSHVDTVSGESTGLSMLVRLDVLCRGGGGGGAADRLGGSF